MSRRTTFKSAAASILAVLFLSLAGCDLPNTFYIRLASIEGVPETGEAGTPLALTANIRPAFASNKDIVWSVIDAGTTGASISGNILNAQTEGIVTIKAVIANGMAQGKEFAQDFKIVFKEGGGVIGDIAVTGVTLNHTTLELDIGETLTLIATVAPLNADNKNVTWTSSDEIIASVSNGVITAIAAGNTVITVTTDDGNFTATCIVTVVQSGAPVYVDGVSLDQSIITMTVGDTVTLIADVTPSDAANKAVTWASGDHNVVTVTNGTVTAVGIGTAVITVTTEDGGKTAECSVDVNDPSLSTLSGNITISPSSGVTVGTELTATYSGSESVTYQWLRNETNISGATSSKYTPTQDGSYTITISASDYNPKTSAAVVVSPGTLSGTITISPSSSVTVGMEMTAVYTGSESVTYQWENDGISVGANSNKYMPTETGSYTVTVTAPGYNNMTSAAVVVTAGGGSIISPTGIEMVSIPAGTFIMGSPTTEPNRYSDETQHSVTLSAFKMGKYQVTQEQYQAVMGSNPSNFTSAVTGESGTPDKLPVETVRWYDTLVFCNKLSVMEGLTPAYSIKGSTDTTTWGTVPTSSNSDWNAVVIVAGSTGYRLPTEAQWEYACRAGTATAFNNGNDNYTNTALVSAVAWYNGNSGSKTHEVGLKAANAWGLYDMHGNVWEWCWDWYDSYSSDSQTDPTGASSGSDRVLRGGSWVNSAGDLRSAYRVSYYPSSRGDVLGFRLVRP